MSSKVSMVIPCYNKVEYVDDMFRSVNDQKWDNIEIIIVNDGSTDGTRKKIAHWESKFKERGYEVVIIDQENQGVGAAVKNGLMRATGDYVCMPDCDDTLSPYYVSRMAEVLDMDPTVEWVWCNVDKNSPLLKVKNKEKLLLLVLLCEYTFWSVYLRLIRVSYLKKCRMLDVFIESRLTQEPQVMIPLAAGGAWPHLVCENLYAYNTTIESSIRNTAQKSYDSILSFWESYKEIQFETLARLGQSNAENKEAVQIALLNIIKRDFDSVISNSWRALLEQASYVPNESKAVRLLQEEAAFGLIFGVAADEPRYITEALKNAEHIVFCCCMGKKGRQYLPRLEAVGIKPDALWDVSADYNQSEYYGFTVTTPEYSCLTKRDVVFVLSDIESNVYEVETAVGGRARVFTIYDIKKYIEWHSSRMFRKED